MNNSSTAVLERPETKTRDYRNPLYVGLDVEGILVLPKADFAWLIYDRKLSPAMRALFPRERCEAYDGKYDDGRYIYELAKPEGHSTGTWPCVSLALAGMDSVTDRDLINYAEKTTQEMPGTGKFLKDAMEKTGGNVYFATSSYPAVALKIAYKYGIPSSHVFTMGRQLPPDRMQYYDEKRAELDKKEKEQILQMPEGSETLANFFQAQRKLLYDTEVMERSPLGVLNEFNLPLGAFMKKYMDVTGRIGDYYQRGVLNPADATAYELFLKEHNSLFGSIPRDAKPLREELENLFRSPASRGNMGSRNKTRSMRQVHDNGDEWFYAGDGIVDGHPIGWARYGVSMNMRDRHALPYSKLSVVTTDVSHLIPVLDQALERELDVEKLKMQLNSAGTQVFSPHDIWTNIETVRTSVGAVKEELAKLYVEV